MVYQQSGHESSADNEADSGSPIDYPDQDQVYSEHSDLCSLLPVGEQQHEMEAVRSQLSANEPMQWPTVGDKPLNEYETPYLATMAFPTSFPDGRADPTNNALLRDVPIQERIKHLVKFAKFINGSWVYRFANHSRFSYWA